MTLILSIREMIWNIVAFYTLNFTTQTDWKQYLLAYR